MRAKILIAGLGILTATTARPDEPPEAKECPELKGYKEVIQCALLQHPDIVQKDSSAKAADYQKNVASSFINPDLEARTLFGNSLGDRITSIEVTLKQTIEIGGKRGARMDKAEADFKKATANQFLGKEEALLEVASDLFRLRQVEVEYAIVDEALGTFSRIERQYRSRRALSPEQQVSLGIFQLALEDYRLKRTLLSSEKTTRTQRLEVITGKTIPTERQALPAPKREWPSIQITASENSPRLLIAKAELESAEAELSAAQAQSWPDISIGPSIGIENQGGVSTQTYGGAISLPLPFWTLNISGRRAAGENLIGSKAKFRESERQVRADIVILTQRYEQAVKAIKESPTEADLQRKHQNTENLFARGLISAPLVIEAHRQMLEFAKSQHEHELLALESLIRLKGFQGKLDEVNL